MAQSSTGGFKEILGKIFAPFASLFERGNSVIGVDIGASSIKIVQLKKTGGQAVLETYGEIALGPYTGLAIGQATSLTQEKTQEALADVIREANITSRDGGFSVPLTASLVLVMDMPEVSRKQLGEMVPIEARKYIPIPIGEVTLDWNIMPDDIEHGRGDDVSSTPEGTTPPKKKIKVLLAAIRNDSINNYQEIATKTQLDIKFLEIEIFSSIRALLRRERFPVLILDLGAGSTKLSIVVNGIAVSTHIINRGSQDMTIALSKSQGISIVKAEEMKREIGLSSDPAHKEITDTLQLILQGIFMEANKMLLAYEKRYNKTISKVVMSGGGSLLKGILDVARKNFDTEVVYADPFSQIETPAFLEPVLKKVGPNFAVSVGVALRRLQEIK